MTANQKDVAILRELATHYAEVCADPKQDEKRALWKEHNGLNRTRPMVVCAFVCAVPELIDPILECEDPFFRTHERFLRKMLLWDYTGDDFVLEPWITVGASRRGGGWGLASPRIPSPDPRGAWRWEPVIKTLDDADKLRKPVHEIDEEATAANAAKLHDAIGDILEVNVSRAPAGHNFAATLSNLRGLEQIMWDMADNPEWLHKILSFLRDGVVGMYDEADRQGHWTAADHPMLPVPYEQSLAPPRANGPSVGSTQLAAFFHAQEYAQVSPGMHDEFMLQYQMPLMERFGFVHYGCCEDLTHKIDILRQVPNLRRIAAVPWADVRSFAEQVGDEYIISWQPNPSDMGCCGFDPDHIRAIVRGAMDLMRGCHVDIVWKDVQTVEGDRERLRRWVEIVREVTESY